MSVKNRNLIEKIKKIKGLEFIIAGVIGLIVIAIMLSDSEIFTSKDNSGSNREYVSSLEERMSKTLSKVKGAGKVSVAITVDGGSKTVIATDTTTIKNGNELQITETPVLVGGKVVVLGENHPQIVGVVVVAPGAEELSVRMALMDAATTLLSIDADKVQILTGK